MSSKKVSSSGSAGSMKTLVEALVAKLDARARMERDPEMVKAFLPVVRPPAATGEIETLQNRLGIELPRSYREFLRVCDGIENFAGTHLLLGARDHFNKKIRAAIDDIAEFWDDEDGEPVEIGVPVAVPDAGMGIRNLWAFAPDAKNGERAVIDWDNGEGDLQHESFRAFLEWSLELETRLEKKQGAKKPGAKRSGAKEPATKRLAAKAKRPAKPPATYKLVRRPLGKLALPKPLDRMVDWIGRQVHGSLGWFGGVRLDRLAGPAAKNLPAQLEDAAVTVIELSEGERIIALLTGPTPIVLLGADGSTRLLAPSLASFVLAWAHGKAGVPDLDHDGSRIVAVHRSHAVTTTSAPSARRALAAWAKAEGLKPARNESFDLSAFLGGAGTAGKVLSTDPRHLPHNTKLEAPLATGKDSDFAKYGAWLTEQGHPLGAVITADAAAARKPALKNTAFKLFNAYVKAHLAPRYSRLAANMAHFTKPDFGLGMSFQYGFLRKLDTFNWTPPMRKQVLDFLENDDHARWLVKLTLREVKLDDLSLLAKFPALRTVDLRWTKVKGVESLAPLAGLRQLRAINLDATAVSDLSPLSKLPLIQLKLGKTAVVDLRPLAGHPTLEHLELGGTKVKDITPLLSCKKLCNVGLYDTLVSKADVEKLIAAMKKSGAKPINNQDDLISGYRRGVSHKDSSW